MEGIDSPARINDIRRVIESKPSLRQFYEDLYHEYAECLRNCPKEGIALELGSGAGFAKELIPELVTSDVLPYEGVDRVIDGTGMPFEDHSLRMICMMNVFHHIPDVEAFLHEAERCLLPGGRVFIADQHVSWFSSFIYRHLHHEPFNPESDEWRFASSGPLSDANGALAWMVFKRDRGRFEKLFPQFRLLRYEPHSPLRYWLAGGLKSWNLIPAWAVGIIISLDSLLLRLSPELGSFVFIELVKQET